MTPADLEREGREEKGGRRREGGGGRVERTEEGGGKERKRRREEKREGRKDTQISSMHLYCYLTPSANTLLR